MIMDPKVVIEKALLGGGLHADQLQTVATVYHSGQEFRVYAPSKATGKATEWANHFTVRTSNSGFELGHSKVDDRVVGSIVAVVVDALKLDALNADIWNFGNEGNFYAALICLHGHTINADGKYTVSPDGGRSEGQHCESCGSKCIRACVHCPAPIRGKPVMSSGAYTVPSFCYNCGRAYPWTEAKLVAATEYTEELEELNAEDKAALIATFDDLVAETPRTELAAHRFKKYIRKAGPVAAEFLTKLLVDLSSETAAKLIDPSR